MYISVCCVRYILCIVMFIVYIMMCAAMFSQCHIHQCVSYVCIQYISVCHTYVAMYFQCQIHQCVSYICGTVLLIPGTPMFFIMCALHQCVKYDSVGFLAPCTTVCGKYDSMFSAPSAPFCVTMYVLVIFFQYPAHQFVSWCMFECF